MNAEMRLLPEDAVYNPAPPYMASLALAVSQHARVDAARLFQCTWTEKVSGPFSKGPDSFCPGRDHRTLLRLSWSNDARCHRLIPSAPGFFTPGLDCRCDPQRNRNVRREMRAVFSD